MLAIDRLTVLHETMRGPARVRVMAAYVRSGGYWDRDAARLAPERRGPWTPIYVARLPDGLLLLHDGHHRVVATYLGGRDHLHAREYELNERTYDDLVGGGTGVGGGAQGSTQDN